jgi:hypothetical protein
MREKWSRSKGDYLQPGSASNYQTILAVEVTIGAWLAAHGDIAADLSEPA